VVEETDAEEQRVTVDGEEGAAQRQDQADSMSFFSAL